MIALSIAFYLKSYLPLSVYELFVKGVTDRYRLKFHVVKTVFNFSLLLLSIVLSLVVFGIVEKADMSTFGGFPDVIRRGGVYIGTVVTTLVNGELIMLCGKLIGKGMSFEPRFQKLYAKLVTEDKDKNEERK
ncbi:MAG: hypothetical protein IJU52_05540 [Clostridia bacterium]|nr:hypothetical protein [Clostridia bacterium]